MSKISKQEKEERIKLAAQVCEGKISYADASKLLGINHVAFAVWVGRHKKEIPVNDNSGEKYSCSFCNKAFTSRLALGAHFSRAHPGNKIDVCGNCANKLTEGNLTKNKQNGRVCVSCAKEVRQRWRKTVSRERKLQYSKEYTSRTRKEVLQHYGERCACCGETIYGFLTIDHINGGGAAHKREIKRSIYQWLKQNKYPEGFQVLCFNCNCAKGIYGKCPHKETR